MRAVVYSRYGSPDVLRIEDVEKPTPKDDEVLIAVRASSVNPLDWHFMRGTPYLARIMMGFGKPTDPRLGVDMAGVVEAVGKTATRLKPGDAVFGTGHGAFAEYACAPEADLALKPDNLTFEQAASVPVAAFTALQGLRDKGKVQPGQKVLINGAAGGVGTFAVQIAKWLGAEVTGVCSTRNVELVRSLGADRVIDYTREDFTRGADRYDLIFDCAANRTLSACKRALAGNGTYVLVGAPHGRWLSPLQRIVAMVVVSRFASQRFTMLLTKGNQEDLNVLADLLQAGTIKPVIDRQYPLDEVPAAIGYLEEGHARGKVVIPLPGR